MKTIGVLTSGGDAPGMNACIRACVRYAIYKDLDVYGVERGYKGLIDNTLSYMNNRSVSGIVQRGGTILRSARCPEFKDIEWQRQAADTLKAYGIDNLIVIGGDGSFRGAKDLCDNCGINVIGIPGTIDNDLAYTDYTLGFDSAVNTVLWAINALRDTMSSHDRVSLLEVMGRNCGDIALYAAVAGGVEYVLTPEVPYDLDEIAASISSGFGGGMGRMREVCGSVSGMVLLASLLKPAADPTDKTARTANYALVQKVAADFKALNGSIVCRELLGLSPMGSVSVNPADPHGIPESPVPSDRTPEYYRKRPCEELVGISARIIGEKINNCL